MTLVAIVIAAVAIGWFLPLLGLSLLAFLTVDTGIGLWKTRKRAQS